MKFRPHRGGFEESMKEVVELENASDLCIHLSLTQDELRFAYYNYDERNGWDTYMVLVNSFPMGYTDQFPVDGIEQED